MPDRRWTVLILLFLARTCFGYQFQTVASSAAAMNAELHLGFAAIGSLIGFYTIPGAALAIPAGMFGARFGDRAACALGLGLMAIGGAAMARSGSFPWLMAGRLVSGAGSILFGIVLTKMVTDWFAGREIVFALGTLMSSWPFGIAAGLVLQGRIAEHLGWRTGMDIAAAGCLAALALILAAYRPPPELHGTDGVGRWWQPPERRVLPGLLTASTTWSLFNVALILLLSFGPALLVHDGMPRLAASDVTSITVWIAILSIPLGGLVLQRTGGSRMLAYGSYILAAIALLAFGAGPAPAAATILFGIAIGPGPGALMAMPARILPAEHRITGLGIFMAWYGAVVGVFPWIAGLMADAAGTPLPALLLGATLMIGCVPLSALFERLVRRVALA